MIIVTGGAGFIGSNIVKGLNDRGIDDIIIVDNLEKAEKHKNLNKIKFYDFIDKRDFNIAEFLQNNAVEAVFHQGASSNTMETDGRYMMKNNYECTKDTFLACQKHNVRLFYASSASVYGNGDKGFTEKEECEYPLNVYAFSKYQFDRFLNMNMDNLNTYQVTNFDNFKFSARELKTQVVGLRYFNVYGPQENHKGRMASVAFHMFNQIKNNEPMKLFEGSQNFKRDFIYIDDVVSVNMFFFEHPDKLGVYNCGTGNAESFCEIANALKEKYTDAKIEYIPFPESLVGKYQTFTQSDITKLRKAGYDKPFISLREGTLKYAEILENSGGYII